MTRRRASGFLYVGAFSRLRRALIREARGLERLPEILPPLEPSDPALAQGPGVGLFVDELPLASPAAYVPVDGGHDDVPTVVQLPELVAGFLPDFGEAAHGLRDRDEPAAHTRFDRVGRIDVLDVRGRELQELLGISIEQPRLVEVATSSTFSCDIAHAVSAIAFVRRAELRFSAGMGRPSNGGVVMPIERKLVVEFIGTFFLVFTVGMAVAMRGISRRWRSVPR